MLRTVALALALGAMFESSALAQTSDVITACEALGGADVVFIGRPRPAVTMRVSNEEALATALEERDRANEELIRTVVNDVFPSNPTPRQVEVNRRFLAADEKYDKLILELPQAEELLLQPVDVVMPIRGVTTPELLVWTTRFGELPGERAYLFYATRPFSFAPDIVLPEREPIDPAHAQDAVTFLEQAVAAEKGASIYGLLAFEENIPKLGMKTTPMAGVPIRLRVDGRAFESTTRSNGTFIFTGVSAGVIEIEAKAPDGLTTRGNVPRETTGVGCVPVQLRARLNGRIRGRVLDERGRPVGHQRVVLQGLQYTNGYHADARTNEDGEFEITSVQPGTYVLGVNLMDKPSCTLPYPPVFHPGTITRADATHIVVGRGTVHDGFEWHLKERLDDLSATCDASPQ